MSTEANDRAGPIREGIELFNRRSFFEAHERWEIAWRAADGIERRLLQGLIQAAAALLHLERGNRRGAASVWARARINLDGSEELMGLDLAAFRIGLGRYFEKALADDTATSPPRLLYIRDRPDERA
jgi:hypothetical protein